MIRQRYLVLRDLRGREYVIPPTRVEAILPSVKGRSVVQTLLGCGSLLVNEPVDVLRKRLDAAWDAWEPAE